MTGQGPSPPWPSVAGWPVLANNKHFSVARFLFLKNLSVGDFRFLVHYVKGTLEVGTPILMTRRKLAP